MQTSPSDNRRFDFDNRGPSATSDLDHSHFPAAKCCKVEPHYEGDLLRSSSSSSTSSSSSSAMEQKLPTPRFLFFERGEWKDFSADAVSSLLPAFRSSQSAARISVGGNNYFIHFLRMLQFNVSTGYLRSIAWIDGDGKCRFPTKSVEGYAFDLLRSNSNSSVTRNICDAVSSVPSHLVSASTSTTRDNDCSSPQSSVVTTSATESRASDAVTSPQQRINGNCSIQLQNKIGRLAESESEFEEVKRRFMAGLRGRLIEEVVSVTVTEISRNRHRSSPFAQARYEAFQNQSEITKKNRGDANLRYGWLTVSTEEISGIILHGFRHSMASTASARHGVGVYLSPESNCSLLRSILCANGNANADEEQHVILCRAIMGRVECVAQGSEQFHPTSHDFDSGVDDLLHPNRYIIWSTNMNTHILPEYIVSFKLAYRSPPPIPFTAAATGAVSGLRNHGATIANAGGIEQRESDQTAGNRTATAIAPRRLPRSPWMTFSMLFMAMKRRLPEACVGRLERCHADFKEGRLSRRELIRMVRKEAGDEVVAECIRRMEAAASVRCVVTGRR